MQNTAWLVRDVAFPLAESGAAAGFDLDGIDSRTRERSDPPTCEEVMNDYRPTLDVPIHGVDNIGQGLITTGEGFFTDRTFDGELDAAIQAGRLRWALRLGTLAAGVDSSIPIELLVVDDAETIALDPDGRPAPNQTLRAHVIATTEARVSGASAWGAASNSEPLERALFLLPFQDFRLGAIGIEVHTTLSLRAQIGGSFSVESLVDALIDETTLTDADRDGSRLIFQSVADIDPSAMNPTRCERVSAGFELDAVPAELVVE